MRLSVCSIVCNEEDQIDAWLDGFESVVDEVIVGDTGSSDATVEKLRARGIEAVIVNWTDDFAAARNEVLEHASGDWILAIDADERVTPDDIETLKTSLAALDDDVLGGIATIRNLCNDSDHPSFRRLPIDGDDPPEFIGAYETHVVRVFRNRDELRYRGRVHELVEMSIEDAGGRYVGVPLFIDHPVPDARSKEWRAKERRYTLLLERKVEDEPTSAKAWWEVGSCRLQRGNLEGALRALGEAWRLAPGNREIAVALGTALLESRRFENVVEIVEEVAERDARAAHQLAIAHANLGDRDAARNAFEKSLELGSNRASTVIGLVELTALHDADRALELLDILLPSTSVQDIATWSVALLESTIAELANDEARSDAAYARAFEDATETSAGEAWERELGQHFLQLTECPERLTRRLRLAQQDARSALVVARALERCGDSTAAVKILEGCPASEILTDEIELVLGRAQFRTGEIEAAEAALARVRARQQDTKSTITIEADYWLAQVKIRRGELDAAAEALESILERCPTRVDALVDIAGLHGNSGRPDIAKRFLRIAATLSPHDSTIHHNLAICACVSDPPDLETARLHRDRAINLGHPGDRELDRRLGIQEEEAPTPIVEHG